MRVRLIPFETFSVSVLVQGILPFCLLLYFSNVSMAHHSKITKRKTPPPPNEDDLLTLLANEELKISLLTKLIRASKKGKVDST